MAVAPRYAVVTGANEPSIGFLVAQRLAAEPHRFRVVLACRDAEKGKAAEATILAADPAASVVFLPLDLASLESVRAFSVKFLELDGDSSKSLSVLVNNAGVGWGQTKTRTVTSDGFEQRFGVNHLGHFLLTTLLLPLVKKAADPSGRIVVVSSSLHDPAQAGPKGLPADIDFDDLQLAKMEPFDPGYAYKHSKLCNVLFTYELQRRLRAEGSAVAVNAMNPGFIPSSGLVRDSGSCGLFFLRHVLDGVCSCVLRVTRSLQDGAECEVKCAVDPAAEKGGEYFELTRDGEFRAHRSSDVSYDEEKQRRLWEESAKLVGLEL